MKRHQALRLCLVCTILPDGLGIADASRRTLKDGNEAIPGAHRSHES